MLLRFFRYNNAPVVIAIPLVGLLLWLRSFISVPSTVFFFDKAPMPLYKFIIDFIPPQSSVGTLIAFLLVIAQGFLLVKFNTQFIFINNRTYLPALFFVLLTASFPDLQRLSPMIFSCFFLLLALEQLFESYRTSKVAYEFFLASFYLAVGALFYPFLLFFMPLIWISLVVLKPFNWREWIFSILGFLAPLLITTGFYYLVYDKPWRLVDDYRAVLTYEYHIPKYPVPVIVFICFIAFLIIIASQFIIRNFSGKKILSRKAFIIFMWLSLNILGVYLLATKASIELTFLMTIPVTYLLSHYFALMKSTFWGNLFLVFIFVMLLVIHLV
jgi:hypothetical protein